MLTLFVAASGSKGTIVAVLEVKTCRVRTAQGKPGKRDFLEKNQAKAWKTQGIFQPYGILFCQTSLIK